MTRTQKLHSSILDRIGNTPLVELGAMVPDDCARILLKVEAANPSGSIKDRPGGDFRAEPRPEMSIRSANLARCPEVTVRQAHLRAIAGAGSWNRPNVPAGILLVV